MNRFIQNIFLILLPFFPLFSWLIYSATHSPVIFQQALTLFLLAIALYKLPGCRRLPIYLICFFIFTIYHLFSKYLNNLIPKDLSTFGFYSLDNNVLACLFLFIVENTDFEEWFIKKMNKAIFFVIILTLLISLIQIKDVTFFISPLIIEDESSAFFFEAGRNYSIYSWISLNSLGITFPILVSILLNEYIDEKKTFLTVVLSLIVVSFLTKTRYVMVSALIVLSQLFLTAKFTLKKKIYYLTGIIIGIILLVGTASSLGVDIQKVIDDRILEKGIALNEAESSAGARLTSLKVFLIKYPEHPWVGVGPHTRDDVLALLGGIPAIHIGYLSYLYFYGVIGCFFLFLALFFLLRDAWRAGKRYQFWGSFYGILAFCLANLTFVFFDLSESGIIIAAIYLRFYRYHTEESESHLLASPADL
ncbi:MAG: hypothetical protein JST09_01575 [Bacteroidetes bacterium]|nr:hypothetical protein [Bacteroidota bacterium]